MFFDLRNLFLSLLSGALMLNAFSGGLSTSVEGAPLLVADGQPKAVILPGEGSFHRFVAGELQHFFREMSGGELQVLQSGQEQINAEVGILVGGPDSHPLVKRAVSEGLVSFEGLGPDDFVLKTVHLGGKPCLIVGGLTEASTMYGAYHLLERYGVVFLLAKDIVPEKRPNIELLELDERVQTSFPRRGFFISNIYPSRGIMHLSEVKYFLDQMAKMKMNYLQFFWFEHEPWIDFAYRGEGKLLGDATGPETGYLTWRYNFGSHLIEDMEVGKELFTDRRKIAPAEFQEVETPEQAFRVAKDFLNEIIRYAKTRKIKVWLCVDPTTLPGNLARYAERAVNLSVPFHPILGAHMCPADPVLHEMNVERIKALAETYPEAEGYFLFIPEMYPDCPGEESRSLLLLERDKFEGLIELWKPYTGYERNPNKVLDSVAGSSYIVQKALKAQEEVVPHAKLGVGGIGHGYVLPILDKLLPKGIPFTNMESSGVWTRAGVPMEYFGGMGERERTILPRIDDDANMFGMQFNVRLYYQDRLLEGSLEHGVAGFAGQLNRPRGMEQNYRFFAEGAWEPHLTPEQFYRRYARRIFGESAQEAMVRAFESLEEKEGHAGYHYEGVSDFGCCGPLGEIGIAYRFYKQPNPFDGPRDWSQFISDSHAKIDAMKKHVELLEEALRHLEEAAGRVDPRGREELNYIQNKTEAHLLHLEALITIRQAYMRFENAFRLWKPKADHIGEFVRQLDESMALFEQAAQKGRRAVEKFAEYIDHPSDLGVLYRADLFLVRGFRLVEETMRNIVNYHHGRDYTRKVDWDAIYWPFPEFGTLQGQ